VIVFLIAALIATPKPSRGGATPQGPVQQEQLSDAELKERVQTYLSSIDRPISAARWKGLGPNAAPLLEGVIADGAQFPTIRAKAVDGLIAVAPDRAAALVGKLARDETEPVVVRVAAMHGAGQVLSSPRAVSELRPVLRSARNPGLRAQAAEALSRSKGGCTEVRDQVSREAKGNRGAFERALKQCGD
jgi:hypothetical protein